MNMNDEKILCQENVPCLVNPHLVADTAGCRTRYEMFAKLIYRIPRTFGSWDSICHRVQGDSHFKTHCPLESIPGDTVSRIWGIWAGLSLYGYSYA